MCLRHYCPLCSNSHPTPKGSHGCLMLTISGWVSLPLAEVFIIGWVLKVLEVLAVPLELLRQFIKFLFAAPYSLIAPNCGH